MASSMGNMMDIPAYEVRRLPGFGPKKLVMKKTGSMEAPLAMVEGNMLNVNPGSDPCLMICFLAVSDEMDFIYKLVLFYIMSILCDLGMIELHPDPSTMEES